VTLYVNSLHAEATEVVKLQDALSAPSTLSVWILEKIGQMLGFVTAPSVCGFQQGPKYL